MTGFARVVVLTALAGVVADATAQESPPEPGETVDAPSMPGGVAQAEESDGSENTAPRLVDRDDDEQGLSLLVAPGASVITPLPAPGDLAIDAEGDALGWRFADGEDPGRSFSFDGGKASLVESATGWRLSVFADVDAPDAATLRLRAFETETEGMLATEGTWDIYMWFETPEPEADVGDVPEPSTDGTDTDAPSAPVVTEGSDEGVGSEPAGTPGGGDGDGDRAIPDAAEPEPEPAEVEPESVEPEPVETEPADAAAGPDADTASPLETVDLGEGAIGPDTPDEPAPGSGDPGDGGDAAGPIVSPGTETETGTGTGTGAPSGETAGRALGLRLVAASDRVIVLEWDAASDSSFLLERDGVPVTQAGQGRFVDTEVVAGAAYRYALVLDGTGERTVASSLTATAAASGPGPDRTSPLAPGEVVALRREDGSTIVAWQAGGDDRGVDGYDVYRDGRYVVTVFTAGWIDPETPDAVGTVYEVAAFDAARNYSHRSVATFVDEQVPSAPADTMSISVTRDDVGRFSFAPVNRSESVVVLVGSEMVTAVWPPAKAVDAADAAGFHAVDPTVEVYVLPAFEGSGETIALRLELMSEGSPSSTVVFDPSAALSRQ